MADQDNSKKNTQQQDQKSHADQPSGYSGESPATAGKGKTTLQSNTPENRSGQINPSSPTQSTEGPSTNLGNPSAGGEGMGSMGYGGFDKPRTEDEPQNQPNATASQDAAASDSEKRRRPGSDKNEEKKEVA